jgi:hypothetical protein
MENLDTLVEISVERFEELEKLERSLPDLIAKAIADSKRENLRKLHEKDKNNPEAVRNRVKRYIQKNRDKINEKRRERRKQKLLEGTEPVSEIVTFDQTSEITVSFND